MDVLTTSLEALLQRATNPQNQNPDTAAIEAFSVLVSKEYDGPSIAVRLLASKIQSTNDKEALQALNVLDHCMKHCGQHFHAEVGKFRFLNEMIKLVSPKYLGSRTPISVRSKVICLMYTWTQSYPKELKIKEAFEMLKKQGVIKDEMFLPNLNDIPPSSNTKSKNTIFEDEEKSKLLQKLLRSKNPDDLQAANRLIKTMVREDEKRVEMICRRSSELETVHNNARLLNEMLDSYRPGQTSEEEMELIRELYQSCERLRPAIFRLASETQHSEEMLNQVLQASDELGQVFEKYSKTIVPGKTSDKVTNSSAEAVSLLDLTSPSEHQPETLTSPKKDAKTEISSEQSKSDIDVLADIFSMEPTSCDSLSSNLHSALLQPLNIPKDNTIDLISQLDEEKSKTKGLEDIDILSENLLKQNLFGVSKVAQFKKSSEKTPMNMLSRPSSSTLETNLSSIKSNSQPASPINDISILDLDYLTNDSTKTVTTSAELLNGDDTILNISSDTIPKPQPIDAPPVKPETNESSIDKSNESKSLEIKPLTDLFVTLDSIKPSKVSPLTVLEDKNEISVTLHFAKDSPRADVSVIVVTTISKNCEPVSNYLFQAVVPKTCKLKLQPPSGSDLPAHNPFLPPAAITQVVLIANPSQVPVSLKFIISYMIGDEMFTEMGDVEKLPLICTS